MIVCLCLNVSEADIVKAIKEDRLGELLEKSNIGSVCGSCMPDISDLVNEYSDEHSS